MYAEVDLKSHLTGEGWWHQRTGKHSLKKFDKKRHMAGKLSKDVKAFMFEEIRDSIYPGWRGMELTPSKHHAFMTTDEPVDEQVHPVARGEASHEVEIEDDYHLEEDEAPVPASSWTEWDASPRIRRDAYMLKQRRFNNITGKPLKFPNHRHFA